MWHKPVPPPPPDPLKYHTVYRDINTFASASTGGGNLKLRLSHKFWFSNLYIFAFLMYRPIIFQTKNSVFNHLRLKYQKFTQSGCNDIWIRKFEFVAKTQFLRKCTFLLNLFLVIFLVIYSLTICIIYFKYIDECSIYFYCIHISSNIYFEYINPPIYSLSKPVKYIK